MQETWVWSLGWEDLLEQGTHPLQYCALENSMDCIVHGVAKSWTRLRDFHFTSLLYYSQQRSWQMLAFIYCFFIYCNLFWKTFSWKMTSKSSEKLKDYNYYKEYLPVYPLPRFTCYYHFTFFFSEPLENKLQNHGPLLLNTSVLSHSWVCSSVPLTLLSLGH